MDPLAALFLAITAFIAALIGGIAGLGSAIILIPVLAFTVGIREAIPITAIAVGIQTWSRVWVNRSLIDKQVAGWFLLGAVPASVIGAMLFANLPAEYLQKGLAVFLLAIVVYRHTSLGARISIKPRWFTAVGMGQGFLSAIFGGAGPFGASFFLSYGLRRGAFVGTMASGMTGVNLVKIGVYSNYSLLDLNGLVIALLLGLIMVVGAYIGGLLINRLSDKIFVYIVELVMLVAAVSLFWG